MRSFWLSRLVAPLALAAAVSLPNVAHAADGPPVFVDRHAGPAEHMERHAEFTVALGYGYGTLRHPNYLNEQAGGFFLDLGFGFALNKRWTVGAFLNHIEMPIDLVDGDDYVRAGTPKPPIPEQRGSCETCIQPLGGGDTIARQLYTVTVGPRVEVAPFGQNGPYVGMSGGVSTIAVESHNIGGALGLKAGYRVFAANMVAVGLAVDVQRIMAPESDAWLSMASIDLRGCFRHDTR